MNTNILVELISCVLDFETPAVSMEEVKDMAELIPGLSEDIEFLQSSFKAAGITSMPVSTPAVSIPDVTEVVTSPTVMEPEEAKQTETKPDKKKKGKGHQKHISIKGLINDLASFIKKEQAAAETGWVPVLTVAEKFAKEKALGKNQKASVRFMLRQMTYADKTEKLWLYDAKTDEVSVV